MERAARGCAAGVQAAFAAKCASGPAALHRVITALPGQRGTTLPAGPGHEPLGRPGGYLERRTLPLLSHVRAGARR